MMSIELVEVGPVPTFGWRTLYNFKEWGRNTHVYVIRRPDTREYKVGITRDPLGRLSGIQASQGVALELCVAFRTGERVERLLAHYFADARLRGEWYRETPALLDWIERQRATAIEDNTLFVCTPGVTRDKVRSQFRQ